MNHFKGIRIYESTLMVDTKEYQVQVKIPFRERFIEPILHPVTKPFEPWVDTKMEIVTRSVPSRKVLHTPDGLFMHPAMKQEMIRALVGVKE